MLPFLTAAFENSWGHGVVGCTIAAIMACLDQHIQIFSQGRKMTRAFGFLVAAMVVLAGAGHAQAQFFFDDSRDIMGGGPGFFRPGMPNGSRPVPPPPLDLARR